MKKTGGISAHLHRCLLIHFPSDYPQMLDSIHIIQNSFGASCMLKKEIREILTANDF